MLIAQLHSLQSLTIKDCRQLNDDILLAISHGCSQLMCVLATATTTTTTTTTTFYSPLSGTTLVSRYQKKHSPTHSYPDQQSSFIHLLWSIAFFLVQFMCLMVFLLNLCPSNSIYLETSSHVMLKRACFFPHHQPRYWLEEHLWNKTRSHPAMVGDMSHVTLNFDLSKIPFVHF